MNLSNLFKKKKTNIQLEEKISELQSETFQSETYQEEKSLFVKERDELNIADEYYQRDMITSVVEDKGCKKVISKGIAKNGREVSRNPKLFYSESVGPHHPRQTKFFSLGDIVKEEGMSFGNGRSEIIDLITEQNKFSIAIDRGEKGIPGSVFNRERGGGISPVQWSGCIETYYNYEISPATKVSFMANGSLKESYVVDGHNNNAKLLEQLKSVRDVDKSLVALFDKIVVTDEDIELNKTIEAEKVQKEAEEKRRRKAEEEEKKIKEEIKKQNKLHMAKIEERKKAKEKTAADTKAEQEWEEVDKLSGENPYKRKIKKRLNEKMHEGKSGVIKADEIADKIIKANLSR